MATVLVLDDCDVRYEGRASRETHHRTFLVTVKDDGSITLQSLHAGVEPVFWNSAGNVAIQDEGARVRIVSQAFAGEMLECAGVPRFVQEVECPGEEKPAAGRAWREETAGALSPAEARLLEALRAWRLGEARRRGVAAFAVATNATLDAIARLRPRDAEALGRLHGMGPLRLERYGAELLKIVREHALPA